MGHVHGTVAADRFQDLMDDRMISTNRKRNNVPLHHPAKLHLRIFVDYFEVMAVTKMEVGAIGGIHFKGPRRFQHMMIGTKALYRTQYHRKLIGYAACPPEGR